jgi:anthranilate phosphoribosyltransferase
MPISMSQALTAALHQTIAGEPLSADQMQAAIGEVMDGQAEDVPLAALLTALRVRGETVEVLVGAARAMSERAARVPVRRAGLLDTCGTGGSGLHTFNVSTTAALVVAACGVPVAKHGNRAASSRSGSADVLEALGVNIELPPAAVAECIDAIGIGFCYARVAHGAMKHAAPVRGALGFRTVFNYLGPLTNPAGAEYQLLGACRPEAAELLAGALLQLGRQRALVVCGNGEFDEVALWGRTTVHEVDGQGIRRHEWTAGTFGLPECRVDDLCVDSPQQSAAIVRAVLSGEDGPARNMVLANAAAALLTVGAVSTPTDGVARAAAAIDSGAASELLGRLVEWSNR